MRMRMRGLSMISDVKEEAEKFLNMEPKPRYLGLEHINNNQDSSMRAPKNHELKM